MTTVHLIRLEEAGRLLQLNPATLRRRVKSGDWPAYRVGKRGWRLDLDEILQHTRANRERPDVPTRSAE
jgi:excisionase family DNA binding protein